jgi:hypothetical protein
MAHRSANFPYGGRLIVVFVDTAKGIKMGLRPATARFGSDWRAVTGADWQEVLQSFSCDLNHRPQCYNDGYLRTRGRTFMLQPSHIITYLFAAAFGAVGVVILRRAFRPSCRVCLHRKSCPNREGDQPSEAARSTCLGE